MPEGAVYVGRPTIFGNPWAADLYGKRALLLFRRWVDGSMSESEMREEWNHLTHSLPHSKRQLLAALPSLRGKDVACWCPLDQPCHADILLEIANA